MSFFPALPALPLEIGIFFPDAKNAKNSIFGGSGGSAGSFSEFNELWTFLPYSKVGVPYKPERPYEF